MIYYSIKNYKINNLGIQNNKQKYKSENSQKIITEYCDAGDLNNYIKKKERIDEMSAFNEMNQKGYIHRDINPANILIEKNFLKIADFGFALPTHEARLQGKNFNVETSLYMSPQALRQQGHSEKGDIRAIYVVFFEMLYEHHIMPLQKLLQYQISCINLQQFLLHLQFPIIQKISLENVYLQMKIQDYELKIWCIMKQLNKELEHLLKGFHFENLLKRQLIQIFLQSLHKFKSLSDLKVKELKKLQLKNIKLNKLKKRKNKMKEQIQRSSSQLQALQKLKITKTSAFQEQVPVQKQKSVSLEFKSNVIQFLYKFSQNLASCKIISKEIFFMSKNITIKINKLSTTLLDKENKQINIFQLDDQEEYKKSESHNKFSQAISEYDDKYIRNFEKILNLAFKNEFQKDQLIGCLCNNDISENESFYKIALQYIKQSINEIKQNFKPISGQKDQLLPKELQMPSLILFGVQGQQQLISKTMENWLDYKQFQKAKSPELLIERKQGQMNYGQLEQLL